MGILGNSTYGIFTYLIILFIGITYLYGLVNLYTGHKVRFSKYVVLGINFLFLIGYLVLLMTIRSYNHIPLVILLLILLAIIVLGIIGGFMFDEKYSIDQSSRHKQLINTFAKLFKALSVAIVGLLMVNVLFRILTHEVEEVSHVQYILNDTHYLCDSDIIFSKHDEAHFFLACDFDTYTDEDFEIAIFLDDVLIHSSSQSNEANLIQEEDGILSYDFSYDFDNLIDYRNKESITVTIIDSTQSTTYDFLIEDRVVIDYETKVKPIWVQK